MTDYSAVRSTEQFNNLMRDLDFPSAEMVEELTVPKMKFITVVGKGSPQSNSFQPAIQSLYGIAFTIKMGLKFGKLARPDDYYDFKVPPLEGLWWQADGKWDMTKKNKWQWKLMIMMPNFVNQELIDQARQQAEAKHPDTPYSKVALEEFDEGKSIQVTHIGPYSSEAETINKLSDYASNHSLQINGKHHEIYMGDPRRTKPERLKTVLRYAIG